MSKTTTPMTKPQREMLLAAAAREDGCAMFVINAEGRAVAAGLEA